MLRFDNQNWIYYDEIKCWIVLLKGGYMANNREFFCNHCGTHTLFFLDSDLNWYCDECGRRLDNNMQENEDNMLNMEDELEIEEVEEDEEQIFRCPSCDTLISVETLVDGYLCPVCLADVSEKVRSFGYFFRG